VPESTLSQEEHQQLAAARKHNSPYSPRASRNNNNSPFLPPTGPLPTSQHLGPDDHPGRPQWK
jgi:hypothetical protein